MATRLVIDGNAVYEIDEDCLRERLGRDPGRPQAGAGKTGEGEKKREYPGVGS